MWYNSHCLQQISSFSIYENFSTFWVRLLLLRPLCVVPCAQCSWSKKARIGLARFPVSPDEASFEILFIVFKLFERRSLIFADSQIAAQTVPMTAHSGRNQKAYTPVWIYASSVACLRARLVPVSDGGLWMETCDKGFRFFLWTDILRIVHRE